MQIQLELLDTTLSAITAIATVVAVVLARKAIGIAHESTVIAANTHERAEKDAIAARGDAVAASLARMIDTKAEFLGAVQLFWKHDDAWGEGGAAEAGRARIDAQLAAEVATHVAAHQMEASATHLSLHLKALHAAYPAAWSQAHFHTLLEWVDAARVIWKPHYLALVNSDVATRLDTPYATWKMVANELEGVSTTLRAVIQERFTRALLASDRPDAATLTTHVLEGYFSALESAVAEFVEIGYVLARSHTPLAESPVGQAFAEELHAPRTARDLGTLPPVLPVTGSTPSDWMRLRLTTGAEYASSSLPGLVQAVIPDYADHHPHGDGLARIRQSAFRRATAAQADALRAWAEDNSLAELGASAVFCLLQPKDQPYHGHLDEHGALVHDWNLPVTLFLLSHHYEDAAGPRRPRGNVRILKSTSEEDYLSEFGTVISATPAQ